MASPAGSSKSDKIREYENRLANLYDEYYDRIAHYVYVRIGDKNEAEDIASEVFLKALKSIKSYEEQGVPMQAWLFKIAHNLVVDHFRRKSKYKTVSIDNVEILDDTDPADTAEINITMESVGKAMEKLTVDQREVLQLRFFGGLSSKEVAGAMKKTDGSVREMQRSALEKLRQILMPDKASGH
jgi:RNA polymerase sigma-70 factor (ECF subfamily)